MKLIRLPKIDGEVQKHAIIQDDAQRIVELVHTESLDLITVDTLTRIVGSRWYGWVQNTPDQIRAYKECDELRDSPKLKVLMRYAKILNEGENNVEGI